MIYHKSKAATKAPWLPMAALVLIRSQPASVVWTTLLTIWTPRANPIYMFDNTAQPWVTKRTNFAVIYHFLKWCHLIGSECCFFWLAEQQYVGSVKVGTELQRQRWTVSQSLQSVRSSVNVSFSLKAFNVVGLLFHNKTFFLANHFLLKISW